MEINYDLIIKYLAKNKSEKVQPSASQQFITQKNIFNYATNFPGKFKEIFIDKNELTAK